MCLDFTKKIFLFFLVVSCRTMSRLTPGIPQVPIKIHSSLSSPISLDLVMSSLKNHQSVVIFKCGSNSKARLLHLSMSVAKKATKTPKIITINVLKFQVDSQ